MDLKIECPKCRAQIDITKQIAELVADRGKQEAERIVDEERKKTAAKSAEELRVASEAAAKKAREEERTRLDKISREAQAGFEAKAQQAERQRQEQEQLLKETQKAMAEAQLSAGVAEKKAREEERAKIEKENKVAQAVLEAKAKELERRRQEQEQRFQEAQKAMANLEKAAQDTAKKAREEERAKIEKENKAEQAIQEAKAKEYERQRHENERRLEEAQMALAQIKKTAEQTETKAREEEREKAEKARLEEASRMTAEMQKLQESIAAKDKEVATLAEERAKQEAEKIRGEMNKSFSEKLALKDLQISEAHKKLLDSQTKAQELEAKLSQGSAQARGVIAEEDIYAYLQKKMPTDRCQVEKRGQGKKGTDIIIHVHKDGARLGSIIVDDKWAGEWGRDWPEKVWNDMQMHKADFAYIAANPTAFPDDELKGAGFGLAPCRRAGVRVWVIDRSNLPFVRGMLMDTVDKIVKMAEIRAVYGANSEAVKQFQMYLTQNYEVDLREKAKLMSTAVKSVIDMNKKVNTECERILDALRGYWMTEEKVHRGLTSSLGDDSAKDLPKIEFDKDGAR